MKKKIKNLTNEDCHRICTIKKTCANCPLNFDGGAVCMADLKNINVKILEERQEQLIYVYLKK